MKKLVTLIVILMTLVSLTSCGKKSEETTPIWMLMYELDQNELLLEISDKEDFSAHDATIGIYVLSYEQMNNFYSMCDENDYVGAFEYINEFKEYVATGEEWSVLHSSSFILHRFFFLSFSQKNSSLFSL